jgi:hypothetical protein
MKPNSLLLNLDTGDMPNFGLWCPASRHFPFVFSMYSCLKWRIWFNCTSWDIESKSGDSDILVGFKVNLMSGKDYNVLFERLRFIVKWYGNSSTGALMDNMAFTCEIYEKKKPATIIRWNQCNISPQNWSCANIYSLSDIEIGICLIFDAWFQGYSTYEVMYT